MLLNSTDLSKSFSFGMLLINERLSLIPPSHGGWFFGLLLSRSLFIYSTIISRKSTKRTPYRPIIYNLFNKITIKSVIRGSFLCTYVLNRMKLTFRSILNAKQAVARFNTATFTNKNFFNNTIDRSCNCSFHLHSFCYD